MPNEMLPMSTWTPKDGQTYEIVDAEARERITDLEDGTVKSVNSIEPDANGNVTLPVPSKTSDLTNDSGFITVSQVPSAPVQSVNTKTGAVVLSASDVGAMPSSYVAPVTSVNGKTGVVVLGASDVGALPDDTVIPPAVTESTVSGWGFTKNTGTYSKPSGGIPKTDLASSVQATLGQVATNTSGIGDLKSAFYVSKTNVALFEAGGLYGGNGQKNGSATNRIRTASFIPATRKIRASSEYKFALFCYDGSTYLGNWTGSEFIKNFQWKMGELDISAISPLYDIKIVVGKTNDATITVSEASNVDFINTEAETKFNEIIINVKDYGAAGDGETEDTEAIAKALNAVSPGNVLFFPVGTYVVDNIQLKSNMIVRGEGFGSVIKLKSNASASPYSNCLTCRNISNVRIEYLCLDGNRTNNSTTVESVQDQNFNGIFVTGCHNIVIDGVLSKSNGFHGCIMTNNERVSIVNSEFTDNGFRPFHAHAKLYGGRFVNNYCHDNGKGFPDRPTPYDGILFFHDIRDIIIANNTVDVCNSVGCIIFGGKAMESSGGTHNIIIANNVMRAGNSSTHGVVLIGSELDSVVVSGNAISDCYAGIYGDGAYDIGNNIVICNNTIRECVYGVLITGAIEDSSISDNSVLNCDNHGLFLQKVKRSTVSGNTLRDNGGDTQTFDGIRLYKSQQNLVKGNTITNSVVGEFQNYGIKEDGVECDSNIFVFNNMTNMGHPAIGVVGQNSVVKDNMSDGVFVP